MHVHVFAYAGASTFWALSTSVWPGLSRQVTILLQLGRLYQLFVGLVYLIQCGGVGIESHLPVAMASRTLAASSDQVKERTVRCIGSY